MYDEFHMHHKPIKVKKADLQALSLYSRHHCYPFPHTTAPPLIPRRGPAGATGPLDLLVLMAPEQLETLVNWTYYQLEQRVILGILELPVPLNRNHRIYWCYRKHRRYRHTGATGATRIELLELPATGAT